MNQCATDDCITVTAPDPGPSLFEDEFAKFRAELVAFKQASQASSRGDFALQVIQEVAGTTRGVPLTVETAVELTTGTSAASFASNFIPPIRGLRYLRFSHKILRQMGPRGWTFRAIDEAVETGQTVRAINKSSGNPATRFIHPETGQSVIIDDATGEVIQVGGPGFRFGPGSGDLQ